MNKRQKITGIIVISALIIAHVWALTDYLFVAELAGTYCAEIEQDLFSAGLEMDNRISVSSVVSGNGLQSVYTHDNVLQRLIFRTDFRVLSAGIDDDHVVDADGHSLSYET